MNVLGGIKDGPILNTKVLWRLSVRLCPCFRIFYYLIAWKMKPSFLGLIYMYTLNMNSTHGCKYALYMYPMKGLISFVAGEWHMQNFYRGTFNS